MKCLCPACRRTTRVESELLDFFSRCDRCGVLLRAKLGAGMASKMVNGGKGSEVQIIAQVVPIGRVREGPLRVKGQITELLTRREVRSVSAGNVSGTDARVEGGQGGASRSRRAVLQRNHSMLGMIGLCGSGLIALLTVGVLAIRSYATSPSKGAAGDTISVAKNMAGGMGASEVRETVKK